MLQWILKTQMLKLNFNIQYQKPRKLMLKKVNFLNHLKTNNL